MQRTALRQYGSFTLRVGRSSRATVGTDVLPMVPSNELLHHPAKLRDRLDQDGYLYFSRVVPREVTVPAAEEVEAQMLANGWTTEAAKEEEVARHGICWGIPALRFGQPPLPPTVGFRATENMRSALCGSSVMGVVRNVFGGAVTLLPQYTLEFAYPGEEFGFSTPSVYMNRGTKLCLSAWVPLLDVPFHGGGLLVAQGSNSADAYTAVRQTYSAHEVEGGDIRGDGCFSHDAGEIRRLGQPLHGTGFEAGDLVLTTVYTMQTFAMNVSRHWRVSATSRWVMEGDDVGPDPRYLSSGDALAAWAARRDDAARYPRSMADAKKAWGLASP
jgi:hypothetical protein